MTTKTKGFKIRLDLFLPIDTDDFGKQAAAYATMDKLQKARQVTPELLEAATLMDMSVKIGSEELPDAPAVEIDKTDPANTPLTTDPLPDGAVILESTDALDASVFQTIRLADGTEHFRRISAEQNDAEMAAELAGAESPGKKRK